MTKINEITAQKILSLTGIKQAGYVINPYRGCQFGCSYCYAQKNKFSKKQDKVWGSFVDVKINALELLESELKNGVSQTIMLGSTTEVYQPAENKYKITRRVLELLARYQASVIILTRSDLITRDIDILKQLPNPLICFTINTLDEKAVKAFEKLSPSVQKRIEAIKTLKDNDIPVYAHIGPFLPEITNPKELIGVIGSLVNRVDFENLNLKMLSWAKLKEIIGSEFPELLSKYEWIYSNENNYNLYWAEKKEELKLIKNTFHGETNIYFHPFDSFFQIFV